MKHAPLVCHSRLQEQLLLRVRETPFGATQGVHIRVLIIASGESLNCIGCDIRNYINQMDDNEQMRMRPVLLPVVLLFLQYGCTVRISLVEVVLHPSFPQAWMVLDADGVSDGRMNGPWFNATVPLGCGPRLLRAFELMVTLFTFLVLNDGYAMEVGIGCTVLDADDTFGSETFFIREQQKKTEKVSSSTRIVAHPLAEANVMRLTDARSGVVLEHNRETHLGLSLMPLPFTRVTYQCCGCGAVASTDGCHRCESRLVHDMLENGHGVTFTVRTKK